MTEQLVRRNWQVTDPDTSCIKYSVCNGRGDACGTQFSNALCPQHTRIFVEFVHEFDFDVAWYVSIHRNSNAGEILREPPALIWIVKAGFQSRHSPTPK